MQRSFEEHGNTRSLATLPPISEEEDEQEQERRANEREEEDEQQLLLQKQHPNVCEREEGVTEHGLHARPAGAKLYTLKAKVDAEECSIAGVLHTRVHERVAVEEEVELQQERSVCESEEKEEAELEVLMEELSVCQREEQVDAQVVKEWHSVHEREVEEHSARFRALARRALIYGLKRLAFQALQDHLDRGFRISVRATRLCWQRENKTQAKVLLAYLLHISMSACICMSIYIHTHTHTHTHDTHTHTGTADMAA